MPDQSYLKENFEYNPETGVFKRKGRKYRESCSRTRCRTIRIKDKKYYAHRLIFVWMTGEDPGSKEVDHINHNPQDNRWKNLRLVDRNENEFNTRQSCIRKRARRKPFQARLTLKGRSVCRSFSTHDEAEKFVKQMKQEMSQWK